MPSTQDIKDRLSATEGDRPYEAADSAARALRGRVGLGRNQNRSQTPTPPAAPPQEAPPPAVTEGAGDTTPREAGLTGLVQVAPSGTTTGDARLAELHGIAQRAPDIFAPGNPYETGHFDYGFYGTGGLGRLSDYLFGRKGLLPVDPSDPFYALGPVGELAGPTRAAEAAVGAQLGRLKTGAGELLRGRAPQFVTEAGGEARLDFGMGDPRGERRLGPEVVKEVQRLSGISQRLRAIGLTKDAAAVDAEMRLAASAQPEGLATAEHVGHLEDIISTKQLGGHYVGREAEQVSDLGRVTKMRDAVERSAAAEDAAFQEALGPKPEAKPRAPGAKGGESTQEGVVGSMPIGLGKNAKKIQQMQDGTFRVVDREGKVIAEGKTADEALAATHPVDAEAPIGEPPRPHAKPPGEPPARGGGAEPPAMGTPGVNLGINLAKVDAPQHVKDLIEAEARAHIGDITAQRRGVQHLEDIFARARNLGIDVPQVAQVRAGTPFNAEGAVALFGAIVKSAEKRVALEREIQQAGVMATPEMEARWLAAVYDQNALQRVFAGGRAEAGRSMRALRELSDGAHSGQVKDTFSRALEAIGGRQNFDKLLSRLKAVQLDPLLSPIEREIAAFKLVGRLNTPKFWDKINEAFINSILSNPLTHEANVLGQTALFEADTLAAFPAAVFDTVVSGGGRFRPRERTLTGAVVQAVAGIAALKRATSEALLYMRTGVSAEAVEKFRDAGTLGRRQALEGSSGTFLNIPTRALGAEDVFFNRLGYQRSLHQDAANYVARDGRDTVFGRNFWRRVADVAAHPEDFLVEGRNIAERAEEAGRRAGLRQDAGEWQQTIQKALHWEVPEIKAGGKSVPLITGAAAGLRPGVFIAPFVRIGFNLARVGTEYSPLGFLRVATQRGGTQADAFGRALIGSSLWWGFWQMADKGELTGAAPSNPKDAAQFYDEGKKPYSVKIGSQWFDYGRYEPIATSLKWVHGFHEAAKELEHGTTDPALYGSALLKATGTIARALTDSSYLQGIDDFFKIVNSSDASAGQKLERFAGNLANSILPVSGMRRFFAQMDDPTMRHPTGAVEQIEAATPGLSRLVRPYLTHWGEPVARSDRPMGITASQQTDDPIDRELRTVSRSGKLTVDGTEVEAGTLAVSLVQADIDGFKLSKDQGFMLQQVAGRASRTALAELFSGTVRVRTEDGKDKRWAEMNDRERLQAVEGTLSNARRTARAATADAILTTAKTDGQVSAAAKMRLSTIPKVSDRSDFLKGLERAGKLSASVRRYLDEHRSKGERTVAEYLRLGSGL